MRINNHHIQVRPDTFFGTGNSDKTAKTATTNVSAKPIGTFTSSPEIAPSSPTPIGNFTGDRGITNPTVIGTFTGDRGPIQIAQQNVAASQSSPVDAQKALQLASQTSKDILTKVSPFMAGSYAPSADTVAGLLQM